MCGKFWEKSLNHRKYLGMKTKGSEAKSELSPLISPYLYNCIDIEGVGVSKK